MITEITLALIALGGTILTLGTSILTMWLKHRFDKRAYEKKHAFSKTLPAVHEVYSILNTLKAETQGKRIIILKAQNGGGRPNLGSHLKSSVVYEVFDSPLESVKTGWQNQALDESYVKVLNQLVTTEEKRCVVNVEELPEGSLLKENYDAHKIKVSHVYEIAEREKEYLYISINYTSQACDTARCKDLERACVNQLRVLFKRNEAL